MPRVRELLYRFRPAGAPGPASAAGVPVDRRADVAAELEPVIAQLADVQRACAALRAQATKDAAAIRAQGAERARAITAAAAARALPERAAATATVQQRAGTESAVRLGEAEQAARELRSRCAPLIPRYVEQVVAALRPLLREDQPAAPVPEVIAS